MKSKRDMMIREINEMHGSIENVDYDEASKRIEREVNEIARQRYKIFNQSDNGGND